MIRFIRTIVSNIVFFAVALAAAVTIWFVAQQQADPPLRQFFQVPVTVENSAPDARVTFAQQLTNVQVWVEGPTSIVQDLTTGNFVALVDLAQQPYETVRVPIEVQLDVADVEILTSTPSQVEVSIEQIISREVKVVVDARGTLPTGFEMAEPVTDPEFIVARGPVSRLNNISEARVTLRLDNLRETETLSVNPIYYNNEGNVASVAGISFEQGVVAVTVQIEQTEGVANKPITVNWVGQEAEGYRLLNVRVEPSSVLITGSPDQLAELNFLSTEPVDITGLKESDTQQVSLSLPPGISFVDRQPFFVTVEIEPIQVSSVKERPVEIRALGETLTATLETESVRVFLFGPLETVDSLLDEDVDVTVDLVGLGPGVHNLEPVVNVAASDVEVRSTQPALVTVFISSTVDISNTLEITGTDVVSDVGSLPAFPLSKMPAFPPTPNTAIPPHFAHLPPLKRLI